MNSTDWDQARDLEQEWLHAPAVAPEAPKPAQPPKDEPITLERAWERFLSLARTTRKLAPATIYKYTLLGRRMKEFACKRGLRFLHEFNIDVLEAFQSEWPDGALASLKKVERTKAFFLAAFARGWIDENPAEHLQGPKNKHRPTMPFTQDEVKRILEAISVYPDKSGKLGRSNSIRLRAFVLLLRYSGMRIGDATTLNVDRLSGNKLFLYTAKTETPVSCVLPDFVVRALQSAPRLSDRHWFWTGRSTIHTAVGTWQRTLRKLFALAGIQKGHAHRFRDTFSVELLQAGVPIERVSVLLGHQSVRITEKHYSPWTRSRQEQVEADLQRAWDRDPIVLLETPAAEVNSETRAALPN